MTPDVRSHAPSLPRFRSAATAAAARRSTRTSVRSARRSCRSAGTATTSRSSALPRKLNLDAADLEQRFRTLSRQFHPDYFYNATPAERRASLERSSYLNDAYRTLRNPIARVEYLLQLEGLAAARPGGGVASRCRRRCSRKCSR